MSTTDPLGNLPENKFTERVELQSNNTKQIYILDNAPFFEGLEVTLKGVSAPLIEGEDYKLVYRIEQLKGAVARDVYNGIELLKDLNGTLIVTGQKLDRGFKKPLTDLATELLRYLNEPIKTVYGNIDDLPTLFPPKPTYRPWFNIGNKQYIASAVDDVDVSVSNAGNDMSTVVRALKERTVQLRQAMIALNVPGHVASKNPHRVTADQLNAHPVDLAAADTALAYGHDVLELVRLMRSSGLQESDIQRYIHRYGGKDLDGTFDFANGSAKIKTEDGLSSLSLQNGNFILETNGVAILRAGFTKTTGKFLEIKSGINTLRFESTGNSLNDAKITLNGEEFITTDNVFDFNPEPGDGSNETIEISAEGDLVKPSGFGSPSVPLKANFEPRVASPSTEGKVILGDVTKSEIPNAVIPASTVLRNPDVLIPNTWKVNGKPLNGNVNLTKADFGLGNVDNTEDLKKPISTAQQAALDGLSEMVHKHDTSELTIDLATLEITGKARIASNKAEVLALNELIAQIPTEGEIPESDLNNRFFGITQEYFDELKKTYFENVPDVSDVIDLRTIEISATSGAKFKVNGPILEAEKGYQYLAPDRASDMGLKKGEIKGGVVLDNVSNEQWVSSSCPLDNTFPYATVVNAGVGKGKLIKPTETTRLEKAGIKVRFNSDIERVLITYKTNVAGNIYVDGEVFAMTVGTESILQLELDKSEHVIAFDFVTTAVPEFYAKVTATDLMGVARDIFSTDENTRFGYYPQTAAFDGRFYLYCNAGNGNVFATVGTYDNTSVSTQFVYIGHVDVYNGQVVGAPTLTYRGVIDFGSAAEIDEHKIDPEAHSASNTVISGLEEVKPFGVLESDGVRVSYDTRIWTNPAQLTVTDVMRRDTAVKFKLNATSSNPSQRLLNAFVTWDAKKKTPAQFKSYKNDLLKQIKPVYEGCFQQYSHYVSAVKTGLVFVKKREDGKHDVLYIDIRGSSHIVFTVSNLNGQTIAQLARENQRNVDVTETVTSSSVVPNTGALYSRDDMVFNPVSQFTYRYNPNNNTMTIMHVSASWVSMNRVNGVVKNVKFNEDVSRFFGSDFVGMYVEANPDAQRNPTVEFGIAASPFPIVPELGDYRQFIDYDELFKSYLAADTVSEYTAQNNGMYYDTFGMTPYHVNSKRSGVTGYFGETELGMVTSSCEYTFPVCIMPSEVPSDISQVAYPIGIYLRLPTFKRLNVHGERYTYQMGVLSTGGVKTEGVVGKSPRQVDLIFSLRHLWSRGDTLYNNTMVLKVATNAKTYVRISCGRSFKTEYQSTNVTEVKTFTLQKADMFLDHNPVMVISMTMLDGADCVFDIAADFSNGGTAAALRFNEVSKSLHYLRIVPQVNGVMYYTPYHITQKTWDWYCATAKNKL